ncbi:MAG TPA: nucleoside monophosphate kinase [Chthoniobacterales bacterium]
MKRRIVLLGPPASGKGSQAQLIFQKYQIPAISTGHLLRDEASANTDFGRQAAAFTSKGQLAPDDLVIAVLQKWLAGGRESYVFDGFPRTTEQAIQLRPLLMTAGIPLEIVLFLECDLPTIQSRVAGRVTCAGCKTIYNVGLHVKSSEGGCPACGGELRRRADDLPNVLEQRMVQYAEKTAPLVSFYENEGILSRINANLMADEVFLEIEKELLR